MFVNWIFLTIIIRRCSKLATSSTMGGQFLDLNPYVSFSVDSSLPKNSRAFHLILLMNFSIFESLAVMDSEYFCLSSPYCIFPWCAVKTNRVLYNKELLNIIVSVVVTYTKGLQKHLLKIYTETIYHLSIMSNKKTKQSCLNTFAVLKMRIRL